MSSSSKSSARVSSGVQSTAGGSAEEKSESKEPESRSRKKPDLAEAVVQYLNVKDGPTGSQQELDDAVAAMVEALPAKQLPDSLVQQPEPMTPEERIGAGQSDKA